MELQYKSLHVAQFKTLDAAQGIAEMIVSVFNNTDAAKERIRPGFFTESLKAKLPKGVWMHDWSTPVAKTLEAVELLAGDARLPEEIKNLGGLYVKGQFNLGTQRGKDAFSDLQFGTVDEFSIGYLVLEDSLDAKSGVRDLIKGTLYEWSPVLVGCNPATALIGTKANETAKGNESAKGNKILADAKQTASATETSSVAKVIEGAKEVKTLMVAVGSQSVEVKAVYLGKNVENSMTMAALSRLNDALFYNVIYAAIMGGYEWDDDSEEWIRTPLPVEEATETIGAACDEFKEIALRVIAAMLSALPADTVEGAKSLLELHPVPDTTDLVTGSKELPASPRAGLKLAQHSEQVHANVQEFTGRVKGLLDLRVKEGRALSQATTDRLQKQYDSLSSACEDMKALLDENAVAEKDAAAKAAEKTGELKTEIEPTAPEGEVASDEKAIEAYSRFLELALTPLDTLL